MKNSSSSSSYHFYSHHSNNHDIEIEKHQDSNPRFKPYCFFVPINHSIMNKHYSSPSSHHSFDKPKNSHDHDHQQILENDKKTSHHSSNIPLKPKTNKQSHDHAVNNGTLKKTAKITWVFSSSLHNHNHDDGKLKNHTCDVCNKVFSSNNALNGHMRWHTQKGSKNGVIFHPPTARSSLKQSHLEFPPANDLSKYLPPISHKTKKRSPRRRHFIDNDEELNIAAETLLYISRGGCEGLPGNLDANHCHSKRQKISSNMVDDSEKMKEQGVLLTRCVCRNEKNLVLRLKIPKDKILQKSQDCKEPIDSNRDIEGKKKISEGETELGSRVVMNFDLNEIPSDNFEDETN